MIPHGVEVYVGLEPIDLRWGFDRLAGLVADRLTGMREAVRCSCSSASGATRSRCCSSTHVEHLVMWSRMSLFVDETPNDLT